MLDMSPYLILGFIIAGLLSVVISPKVVEDNLGGGGIIPIMKASIFGIPLPSKLSPRFERIKTSIIKQGNILGRAFV